VYVFDASAVVNLIKRGLTSPLTDGLTLDLAIYECLNVVWKEYKLLKKLDEETASSFIKIISDVLSIIRMDSIKGSENEVFNLACKEGLTIYDASYLHASMKMQATLITDDRKLKEKGSKYVKVLSTEKLITVGGRE